MTVHFYSQVLCCRSRHQGDLPATSGKWFQTSSDYLGIEYFVFVNTTDEKEEKEKEKEEATAAAAAASVSEESGKEEEEKKRERGVRERETSGGRGEEKDAGRHIPDVSQPSVSSPASGGN